MKKLLKITVLSLVILMTSCTEYSRILKNSDYDKKYEAAVKYYNEGDYFKSETILEELLSVYKGTKRAQEIYYYYAYSHYGLKDFDYAAFSFKNFVKNFSSSDKTEEMSYMVPVCYSRLSPDPSLDQSNTLKAIQEFQLFLDKYPFSERREKCNEEIDKLRYKLEKKAFDLAYLYYKTEDYKASIISLKNVLISYPDAKNADVVRYYVVDASYKLAKNSVESKKKDRLNSVLEVVKTYKRFHNSGEYMKEVLEIEKQTKKELSL